MGDETLTRRKFFNPLSEKKNNTSTKNQPLNLPNNDPLFDKYARKTLGDRINNNPPTLPDTNNTSSVRVGNVTSGLTPYNGTWSVWEAAHLLRRLNFGVKKSDIDTLLLSTPSAAVDLLLTINSPTLPSPTPLNYYQNTLPDSGNIALGSSWTSNNLTFVNANDSTNDYYRLLSLTGWTWGVCINDNLSIREKMTQFWYHFIPVNFDDVRNSEGNAATMCHDYMALLRLNALGNFKTLIKAIAKTPAMLVFLGNQYSTASIPNENFARELMELFTLGKVPTQNYSEDDIKAASKVISGWRVPAFSNSASSNYPFSPGFNAAFHNQTNKTFSAFFGNTTITNQTGVNGANEFDLFFDMLFNQQQTSVAKYICRRLYRFFVYYDIDSNIETNVITPLSIIFINNNWNIKPVVAALFKSQHFFDFVNRGVMIKSPIDFILSTLNTLNINTLAAAGANQVVNQYAIWNYMQNYTSSYLEQGFGLVPNVSGWKAYYQDPTYYQNWINSNTIQKRAALLTAFVNGVTVGGTLMKLDAIAWVQQFPNTTIQDPDLLLDIIIQYLLPQDLPTAFKSSTKIQTLLSGQITNSYWTTAWNNYNNTPTNTSYKSIITTRLNSLFTTILQLAEYQLM